MGKHRASRPPSKWAASLCDGCDRVTRPTWSSDGRSIICLWCRVFHPIITFHEWQDQRRIASYSEPRR